jgi:hypothetical protein
MRWSNILIAALLIGSTAPAIAGIGGTFDQGYSTETQTVSEVGRRVTIEDDSTRKSDGATFPNTISFSIQDVIPLPIWMDGSTAVLPLRCKSGTCMTPDRDSWGIKFGTLAEAQQWVAVHFGGGISAANNCAAATNRNGRLSSTVTLSPGGMADGHLYTGDGVVYVIHNGQKDAYSASSGFVTYLESDDSAHVYRLNPGTWRIEPGCYVHRIANAGVLGTASLSSTVTYSEKAPAAPAAPATPVASGALTGSAWAARWNQSLATCRTWAEAQSEAFPNAFDRCMREQAPKTTTTTTTTVVSGAGAPSALATPWNQAVATCRTWAEAQSEAFPNAFDRCMRSNGH